MCKKTNEVTDENYYILDVEVMQIECDLGLLVTEISGCDNKAIIGIQRIFDCKRDGIIEHWKLFGSNREETTGTGGHFVSIA